MNVGDRVRTGVVLPGIPIGTIGRVKEVGRLFIVVRFEDGRQAYYARHQLTAAPEEDPREEGAGEAAGELGFGDSSVPYGTHMCLLPSTRAEAVEVIARYVAAGLHAGDRCICVLPGGWHSGFRRSVRQLGANVCRAIAGQRLRVASTVDVYLRPSRFSAEKQLVRSAAYLANPGERDVGGVRACGYASKHLYDADGWWEYERRVTPILRAGGVLCLCGYDPAGQNSTAWRRAAALHEYVVRGTQVLPGGLAAP